MTFFTDLQELLAPLWPFLYELFIKGLYDFSVPLKSVITYAAWATIVLELVKSRFQKSR